MAESISRTRGRTLTRAGISARISPRLFLLTIFRYR